MRKLNKILWGLALVALGIAVALNAFGEQTGFELFFEGWWTLFIIVPCVIGLFTTKDISGNLIGLGIGVFLLLGCQDIIDFGSIYKLIIPFIIVVVGLKMIFGGFFSAKAEKVREKITDRQGKLKEFCAAFSGQDLNFAGEEFSGAELTAVFGGIKCDLRNAVITEDAYIKVFSIFGGVDVLLADGVNVKISSNSVFGGVSNKRGDNSKDNAVTVYIDATCIFGGADIK